MQARSKGCILLSYFTEKLKEVRSVSLVRKLIRISVLIFWLGSCPTNFYKVDENPNYNFVLYKCQNDYLLGRHASKRLLCRGQSNLFGTTSGFYNKLQKVCFDTRAVCFKFLVLKIISVKL